MTKEKVIWNAKQIPCPQLLNFQAEIMIRLKIIKQRYYQNAHKEERNRQIKTLFAAHP